MTMQSGDIASRLRAVSRSVSPLVTLEVEALMLMASAERRLAAISKEVRVRVEGSKKRLMTVRPRSVGTFLISRREMSRKDSAVSRMCVISCRGELADAEQIFSANAFSGFVLMPRFPM